MGCGASKKKQGAGDDGDLENVMTANRELDATGSESAQPAKTPPDDTQKGGGDNKDGGASPAAAPAQAKSGLVMDDGKAGPGCLATGSDEFSESEAAPATPAKATPMPSYKEDPSTLAADVVEARTFSLLHFNDVYHLAPSAKEPVGGAARFSYAVKSYKKAYGAELLFSGDCYNPSLMSTVTRGKHMLPILNELEIKCSVYGNHDFDFGIDVLKELTAGSNSKWLMSNVVDEDDERPAADGLMSYTYTQPARGWHKETVKIGVVGVGEEEWLSCVRDLPANIVYRDAVAVARREAQRMRADEGCDVIIALTHMRHNNDVSFTRACPEVDIVLGGHDHFYKDEVLDTGQLLLKSGTDFKQLSHVAVKMPAKEGGRPTYTVERVDITSQFDEDPAVSGIVSGFEEKMREKIEKEICHLDTVLDVMTSTVRTRESAMGNLVADIMREHCRAECAMVNAGVLRAGVVYNPPTTLTIKDLLDIAPIEDVVVCVELTGEQIMGAVENGLSKWPQEEGRFLQVSGMQVVARTSSPGGSRVEALRINGAPLEPARTYSVATTAFLCKGCDGFDVLKGSKFLIDSENGSVLPTLIRQAIEGLTPTEVKMERRESVRSLQKAMGGKESFRYKQAAGVLRRAYLPTIAPQVEGRMVLLGEGEVFNVDDLNKTVPVGGGGSSGSRSPSASLVKDTTREFPIPHGSVVRDPTRVQKAFAALQQRIPTGTVQWAPSMVALLGKDAEILNVTVPTVGMTKLRFLDTGECLWFPSEVVTMDADLRQGFSAGGAMTPPAGGVRTPHGTPARFNSAIVRKASLMSPRSVPNVCFVFFCLFFVPTPFIPRSHPNNTGATGAHAFVHLPACWHERPCHQGRSGQAQPSGSRAASACKRMQMRQHN